MEAVSIDNQIDEIFDKVDDLFLDGKFAEVDAMLPDVDPAALDECLTVAWLTITMAAKDKLRNRASLVDRVRAHFEEAEPAYRVNKLLRGLEQRQWRRRNPSRRL